MKALHKISGIILEVIEIKGESVKCTFAEKPAGWVNMEFHVTLSSIEIIEDMALDSEPNYFDVMTVSNSLSF